MPVVEQYLLMTYFVLQNICVYVHVCMCMYHHQLTNEEIYIPLS